MLALDEAEEKIEALIVGDTGISRASTSIDSVELRKFTRRSNNLVAIYGRYRSYRYIPGYVNLRNIRRNLYPSQSTTLIGET
jgi:hypothetical protein